MNDELNNYYKRNSNINTKKVEVKKGHEINLLKKTVLFIIQSKLF